MATLRCRKVGFLRQLWPISIFGSPSKNRWFWLRVFSYDSVLWEQQMVTNGAITKLQLAPPEHEIFCDHHQISPPSTCWTFLFLKPGSWCHKKTNSTLGLRDLKNTDQRKPFPLFQCGFVGDKSSATTRHFFKQGRLLILSPFPHSARSYSWTDHWPPKITGEWLEKLGRVTCLGKSRFLPFLAPFLYSFMGSVEERKIMGLEQSCFQVKIKECVCTARDWGGGNNSLINKSWAARMAWTDPFPGATAVSTVAHVHHPQQKPSKCAPSPHGFFPKSRVYGTSCFIYGDHVRKERGEGVGKCSFLMQSL